MDALNQTHFLVHLNAKATAKSVGVQLRALTSDGLLPDKTTVTALPVSACKTQFEFDQETAMPTVRSTWEKWHNGTLGNFYALRLDHTPAYTVSIILCRSNEKFSLEDERFSSKAKQKQGSSCLLAPPKLWGWVLLETGVDRVRINVLKQIPIDGIPTATQKLSSAERDSSFVDLSAETESKGNI